MLIPLTDLQTQFAVKPERVLHVGIQSSPEMMQAYVDAGALEVVWVELDSEHADLLREDALRHRHEVVEMPPDENGPDLDDLAQIYSWPSFDYMFIDLKGDELTLLVGAQSIISDAVLTALYVPVFAEFPGRRRTLLALDSLLRGYGFLRSVTRWVKGTEDQQGEALYLRR